MSNLTVKEKNSNKDFMEELYSSTYGEKIKTCIQCGTCSGSCPTSYAMNYTPRQIIALLRAGMIDKVLKSNTMWMCASCYLCTVRCPSGIKFTDMMYELKRLSSKHKLYPYGTSAPALAKIFAKIVNKLGRNAEGVLIPFFYLVTNPFGVFKQIPLGIKFITHNRMPIFPKKIKGQKEIEKIISHINNIKEE